MYIWGSTVRFSYTGMICSGDYYNWYVTTAGKVDPLTNELNREKYVYLW